MGTKLYVGNLSFRTTSEELREAFASVVRWNQLP